MFVFVTNDTFADLVGKIWKNPSFKKSTRNTNESKKKATKIMTTTFNHLRKMIGIIDLIIEMIIGQKTTLISFAFRIFLSFQTAGSSTWTEISGVFSVFVCNLLFFFNMLLLQGVFDNVFFPQLLETLSLNNLWK